jgi:hypothetical protein
MIEISGGPQHLPLQLASRVLSAPGVWASASRLPVEGLGALVTPPLGYVWDGGAAPWESRPGLFVWAPPRRPLSRFARRLARDRSPLPRLWTLARAAPGDIVRALDELEPEGAAGYLLWEANLEALAAARPVAALPIVAEVPASEASALAPSLLDAGADALWIGPPRLGNSHRRLWGPAVLPLVLAALEQARSHTAALPLIAGAGIASAADARRLMDAGASAVALDPAWWVEPTLLEAVSSQLT